jgi:hypothetical protein
MQITSSSRTSRPVANNAHIDPNVPPLMVTDSVLFYWSRVIQIAKLFPIMHQVRSLEFTLQKQCKSCGQKQNSLEVDRSILNNVRRALAECSDEKARLVKEAAGIYSYRVVYHDLSGTAKDVTR